MARLIVTANTDYRGGAAETDITEIYFSPPSGNGKVATFDETNFGAGLISPNVVIHNHEASNPTVRVVLSAPGAFSAAGWRKPWRAACRSAEAEGT